LSSIVATITASLIIQIIVLILLAYGYLLKRKSKYRQHGLVMAAAVVVHLLMIFYIMIPSFVLAIVPEYILASPLELTSIVGLFHGILGIVALALGVWLVVAWRFNRDFNGCFARKKFMTPTLLVWVAALLLGIALYIIFIGPLLVA
jgi:uncharacterized membrane protein YozB (DUF420 family)